MKHIFAVVPVFNRIEYTRQCLDAFYSQTYKKFTVIVCDSGSTDKTRSVIKKYYPKVKFIQGDESWWWSRATQEGIDYALKHADNSDFVLLMNNDCFFDKDYLRKIVNASLKNKAIVGSLCVDVNDNDKVVEAGIRFDWSRGLVYPVTQATSNKLSYFKRIGLVQNVDALPGKGTLIPVSVLNNVGGINVEKFPHYIADYEFSNRAKRAGYQLVVDSKSLIYHHWLATGDSITDQKKYNLKMLYSLMFGRKSMNNIIDWINFVFTSCPKEFRSKNISITISKVLYYLCLAPSLFILKFLVNLTYNIKLGIRMTAIIVSVLVTQTITRAITTFKQHVWNSR